jgi:hypothetical protein
MNSRGGMQAGQTHHKMASEPGREKRAEAHLPFIQLSPIKGKITFQESSPQISHDFSFVKTKSQAHT